MMVLDVQDWDRSVALNTPGNESQLGSAHYADLAPLWGEGRHFPLAFSKAKVAEVADEKLTLYPFLENEHEEKGAAFKRVQTDLFTAHRPVTVAWGDYDNDGWPDLYVTNVGASRLYHNNHDGTFTEIGKKAGAAYNEDGSEQAGMGLSADDFSHSGYQDIVKTNFSDDTPTLYRNRGDNNFDDVTYSAGLGKVKTWLGWGVQFYDFDNSGWPGILIANGHVYPEVEGKALGTSYRQPKVAYYNLRDGTFANITADAGSVLSQPHSGRGMALGDLFNDGHQEALVNNMNEKPSLYYNTAPIGNWISLQLIGVKSNRAALGAAVTLEQGSDKHEEEVRSGDGYISQSDPRLHFGLGKSSKAEKIVIRWPSGLVETLSDLPANQYYVVR
jgi:hypothetical protein